MEDFVLLIVGIIFTISFIGPFELGIFELIDRLKLVYYNKKHGYKVYPVYLSKDQILMLKYAIVRTGDPDLFFINDKLSGVLLENGYSPHLTEYVYKGVPTDKE